MSQEEFDARKAEALKNEPIAKRVRLDEIELSDNSYKDGFVKVGGKTVSADRKFFNELGDILHMGDKLQKDLVSGGANDGGLFTKMAAALKALKQQSKDGEITIIGDPSSGALSGITDRPYNRIPNSDLFGIAETMINKYPMLSPIDVDVRGGGMGVDISLLNNTDIGVGRVSDDDETFKFGFTINNGRTTSLGDFAYRLVCENGMMGMRTNQNFQLKGLGSGEIQKMFEHISEAERRNFIPAEFQRNMVLAAKTPASYGEVEAMYNKVVNNLSTDEEALKAHFRKEIMQNFFRGYATTTNKLINKKIDPLGLSKKEKSFIITGQNMWEIINNLTWLGSNNSGYDWKNQKMMQKIGGGLLSKEYDLASIELLKL